MINAIFSRPGRGTALGVGLLLLLGSYASVFAGNERLHFLKPPSVTHQVFQFVNWKYVDPDRARPDKLLKGAFRQLETLYPEILIERDEGSGEVVVNVDQNSRRFTLKEKISFREAASLIEGIVSFAAPLIEDKTVESMLRYMTINGALRELDPHSNVFSQKHYKDFKVRTSGSFGGIGFTFGIHEGDLTIISPIPDTPADRAGLQSGDKILFIDGEPTTNMGTDAAVGKMRGEPGTPVTLSIGREGWSEPKDFPITREIIHIISVEKFSLGGDGETAVLYVSIKNFQENTADELRRAIEESDSPEIAGVIIDLRNNPGGLLHQAIAVSDGFLDEGVIVSTRSRDLKKNHQYAGGADTPFTTKPLVILVNRGSASASEIVAGALQESRAIVIGQRSFGKGSVQQAYQLMDGGGLLLTVSQYLTPGDISIQSIGIQPDIVVSPVEVSKGRLRLGSSRSHVGEETLENAFTEWGNASREAESEIQYLKVPVDTEQQDSFKAPSKKDKIALLTQQFEIRLARRILGALDSGSDKQSRESLLAAARKAVNNLGRSEKTLISNALTETGVDWAGLGDITSEPRLSVTFPSDLSLVAGTTASVTVTARNDGEQTVHQVWGTTDSDNPLLKNLDFAFGRIDPREEISWTAEVEVPKSAVARWDTITMKVKTAGAKEEGTFSGSAFTRSRLLPEFAYTYTLEDESLEDPSRSGDGIIEEGERVRILLRVQNQGKVNSGLVEVNLHADEKENFYLDHVRQRLEKISPGENRDVPLSFRLLKAKEDGEVSIKITLSDRDHGKFFTDNLKFFSGKPYPKVQARIPPRLSLVKEMPVRTFDEKVLLSLLVTDDESVKEVYAYRGEKKIHYLRNREGGSSVPVKIEVPLEVGSNRLLVVARDQKNISSQKIFIIHRSDQEGAYSEALPAP